MLRRPCPRAWAWVLIGWIDGAVRADVVLESDCGAICTSDILADAVAVDGRAGNSTGIRVEGVVQCNRVGFVEIGSAGMGVAARVTPEADLARFLAVDGGR